MGNDLSIAPLLGVFMLLAIVAVTVVFVSTYNQVQGLLNLIPEMESNISVLIIKRTDLVSRLITVVNSYGAHEAGINEIISRDFSGSGNSRSERGAIERLASLRMEFPDLKADSLYEKLMHELSQVEEDIASWRKQYNSTVRAYNTAISQFPGNIILFPFKFQTKGFLNGADLPSA